jgi:SAM-dependent methyltransferase
MTSIPARVAARLRCPDCGAPLAANGTQEVLRCGSGHEFTDRGGYWDFSGRKPVGGSTERTLESFGYEWNAFDDLRDEDADYADIYFKDLDLDDLEGRIGLDAGCGKGRYTRFLADHLGAVVALDGSSAVEAAARNLADRSNVVVVKADLRRAPFSPGTFDFISALGVLHHLDDPREGFDQLLGYLAPQGHILLYLYSRPARLSVRSVALRAASALRRLTVRMPHRALRPVSLPVAALLYASVVAPGRWGSKRGVAALSGLPMDMYRDKPFRSLALDTFDRLSAPVEHRYVWEELVPWLTEADLQIEAAREDSGWFLLARRP